MEAVNIRGRGENGMNDGDHLSTLDIFKKLLYDGFLEEISTVTLARLKITYCFISQFSWHQNTKELPDNPAKQRY